MLNLIYVFVCVALYLVLYGRIRAANFYEDSREQNWLSFAVRVVLFL